MARLRDGRPEAHLIRIAARAAQTVSVWATKPGQVLI